MQQHCKLQSRFMGTVITRSTWCGAVLTDEVREVRRPISNSKESLLPVLCGVRNYNFQFNTCQLVYSANYDHGDALGLQKR
jgi:hypothetical protein